MGAMVLTGSTKDFWDDVIQGMHSVSLDRKEDEDWKIVKSLTNLYHKYKKEYVLHVIFDPKNRDHDSFFGKLSKYQLEL